MRGFIEPSSNTYTQGPALRQCVARPGPELLRPAEAAASNSNTNPNEYTDTGDTATQTERLDLLVGCVAKTPGSGVNQYHPTLISNVQRSRKTKANL